MNTENIASLAQIDPDYIKIGIIIFIIILVMFFLLTILKNLLAYRLKNKMIDQNLSEPQVIALLQNDDSKYIHVKWFAILMGLGVGLFVVTLIPPLGIHSFGIMAVSVSLSFLFYHWYLQRMMK
ncbi:MAG: hypothetical protein AAF391_14120 [Bacteroidota bacterium]